MKKLKQYQMDTFDKLTAREIQCGEYLLKGLSSKLIAAELHLSPRTVEDYIDNIKTKLCCKNKVELIIALTKHYHHVA